MTTQPIGLPDIQMRAEDRFRSETEGLLAQLGTNNEPMTYEVLVESRASRPDRGIAGRAEPVRVRADLLLPLSSRSLRVRVYRAAPVDAPRPLLLWLHGGAFVGGTLDDIDVACVGLARRTGMAVLSLNYRLAPEDPFPAALQDTYDTIAWLSTNGEVFGGDGRIVAGGQSAGANLVAAACLMARDRAAKTVTGQILCYPWLDPAGESESGRLFDGILGSRTDDEWCFAQYLAEQPITPYAAPLLAKDLSGLPRALVLGAGLDPSRDDARRYAQRLYEAGVSVSYIEYEDTPHAFLNFPGTLSVAWTAIQDIANYLAANNDAEDSTG
jgi:acetyl esterase